MEQVHQATDGEHERPSMESLPPTMPDTTLTPPDIEALDLPPPNETESWDERVIREGIEAAAHDGRPIDDRTARYIAGQLHGGQASALYSLASSGAVQPEVFAELVLGEGSAQVGSWVASLRAYCDARDISGPVVGWMEQAEAQDRTDLFQRISTAGTTTLGQVASIHTPGPRSSEQADGDSPDTFHWGDAARWSPADDTDGGGAGAHALSAEQVGALFGEQADEEIGDVNDFGWYGVVHWPDQSGGVILGRDEQGLRHTWVVTNDDTLTTRWADITNAYGELYERRDAYEQVTGEPELARSGVYPKVWVGSLADYVNGNLHGEWFNAAHEPAVLTLAAKHVLRTGLAQGAEEWFIADYDGFEGAELGEYESFETISLIARGIAEHGEAFGHWAGYVGSESVEEIGRFEDHYRGEWDSFEAYIEDYLEQTEFYRFLDDVPEDMRGYIEVDVEQITRDWSSDYFVAELSNGQVAMFETTT